ncbi:ankyrin repeat domain-containing protein [Sphingomonas sp.]|uniref:ankyrin repeat domain-containing protein n=1 Tax=Sphingomonas sp. TaxID=28214 RepID=UPI003CC5179E
MPLRRSFALAAALLLAAPAGAQFQSEGYKFLQAVREAKSNDVIAALSRPGSVIVNTRDRSTGETALHITVRRGDLPYTSFLLAKGADANVRDGHGITPMLAAIQEGHGDLVPLLVAGHANPNLGSSSGVTPIILATQLRQVETVRSLIAANANPDQRDYNGMSARDYATRDPRASAIARLFADAPQVTHAPVAGPRL